MPARLLWYNSVKLRQTTFLLVFITFSMAILTASKITRSFGAEDIFWNVSVSIPHEAKIALVGPNGAGKTTLIRILIGQDSPSSGDIHQARGLTIGYLPQEAEYAPQSTHRPCRQSPAP